ncbi:hydroxycinnamoyl-CoA:piscidic acid hydroxycinnamoyltransferase-like [Lotus japonicus]|uniref:hydroxycinnamoyl-CoA:piscidic acid hydroxycinnamoyltransferase-like n=1 Tax=Lotus japonicus TaxID=34305 RepID=UPI002584D809|nr:hydroxycinnamoyl-CoA:piscidic acid hydroxycinnamoyltransferase-like [Lotus japonicus]
MVKIQCSYTVTPSETKPTPPPTLSLSHCDQLKLPNHGSQIYLYTPSTTTTEPPPPLSISIHTLRTSLSKALTHYYPFAGRLHWIEAGRMELLCNSKGVHLLGATSDVPFDDFGDLADTHVAEQLAPRVDYSVPIEEVPLLVVQLTWFPCGSITLGLTLCRVLVDGTSLGRFMSFWAKLAKVESLDLSLLPFLDRTVLDSCRLNLSPRFEHPEFSPPPIWEGSSNVTTTSLYATAVFKLTRVQAGKLKKKANSNNNVRGGYTSFEVMSGHLWRCVCKVRYAGNGNQPTRLTTLVNCRNRLSPPLPDGYFGNATFPAVTQTCSFVEIMQSPVGYAAGKIRGAVHRMSDGYVRSALDYLADQKDMNLVRDRLYNSAGQNPNLYVVGWANFPFYETDFGWGKPVCLLPGSIGSDGKAFILNDVSGDGFVVAVCLQPSHVDALKKLFYEDIEPAATSKL